MHVVEQYGIRPLSTSNFHGNSENITGDHGYQETLLKVPSTTIKDPIRSKVRITNDRFSNSRPRAAR